MNGFDIQSALEVAKKMKIIAFRAHWLDRARLIEEIAFYAECMEKYATHLEEKMIMEMGMADSDGASCNQLEAC